MKNPSVLVLVAAVSFLAGAGLTYFSSRVSWISDMANQPSIKPQEQPFEPPPRSVPTDLSKDRLAEPKIEKAPAPGPGKGMGHGHESGTEHPHMDAGGHSALVNEEQSHGHRHGSGAGHGHLAEEGQSGGHTHGAETGHSPAQATGHSHSAEQGQTGGHDHGSGMGHGTEVRNPVEATTASIRQGQQLFGIYCAVCHGSEGKGGMPIAAKYPKIPRFTPRLLGELTDAHVYDMVTKGHGPMPGYAEALSPMERWHVANYLRSLQEK